MQTIPSSRQNAERAAQLYAAALVDIFNGENLAKHMDDVTAAIGLVDAQINKYLPGEPAPLSLIALKNNLWYLKWQILERM